MLSIEDCRKLLPEGEKLTDEEIDAMRTNFYYLAQLLADARDAERSGAARTKPSNGEVTH